MNDRQRLEAIVAIVGRYLPPDGISVDDAMSEIIWLVDLLPSAAPTAPVPEGWKLVPIKPTSQMVNALADTDPEHESVWDAVLAVAPPAAQREWVGLTDEEIILLSGYDLSYAALIGEVQRILKEKNT